MDNFRALDNVFSSSYPFLINTSNGGFYFNLFYILAFLIATGWLIGEGYKRNFHLFTWIIVLAFTRIFFVIGTKVISYSPADWNWVWHNLELVPTSSKVVLGGLFLGTAAVALMMKIFRLPLTTLDAFAFVLPISMAVQRMGCFLAGCCYGKLTNLPIGVSYGHGSLAHFHQYQEGMIEASSLYALPIHPYQLYEALNGIMVVVILWKYRKKFQSAGSLLGLSIGLSVTFRLCLEFLRDENAHAMGAELIGGMKLVQWLLIITALITIWFIVWNEKRKLIHKPSIDATPIYPMRLLSVLMISVMITWSLREWFLPIELLVLNLVLFPAIILAVVHFFQSSTHPQFKWLTLSFLLVPAFLMSQTWKETGNEAIDSTKRKSFDTFRTGFSTGSYITTVTSTTPSSSGCSNFTSEDFENVYWNVAAGFSRTKVSEKSDLIYGVDIMGGKYTETNINKYNVNEHQLYAIYPYIQYHQKWFGVGVGLHLGQNYLSIHNKDVEGSAIFTSADRYYFYPSLYGRLGPERIFFVDGGLANTFPSPFPGMQYEYALGSGFGLPKGNRLRIGGSPFGSFFQAEVLPHPSFLLSGSYVWDSSPTFNRNGNRQILFGLHYRFNHR